MCGEGAGTYSQLQAEGHPQHLKPLHLEIHPDGRLVVLIKSVLAKPGGEAGGVSTSPDSVGAQCPPPRECPAPEVLSLRGRGATFPLSIPSETPRGSRYRLIRQVFPTERSPTTMILEILNLHRGGRATQRGGGHRRAVPGGFGLVSSHPRPALRVPPAPHPGLPRLIPAPCAPPVSLGVPPAPHPGPAADPPGPRARPALPRCPPRSASRPCRGSSRTPSLPRCPPCGSSRIPAPAPRSPGVPPAPHSSAVTQGSAPGSAGSHAAPTPGTPTRGWRRRRSLVTPPARQRGPQTPRDRPHGARPLLLAGAGHRGVEGGAGVQGGLLAKTLRGDKEGQRGERGARRGQPRAGGSPSHRGQVGDDSVPADRGQHVHGPWVAGAAGMG